METKKEEKYIPGGCPSKLSAHDKQSIVHQIKSGKLENAVEATQFINGIIPNPVTAQTSQKCTEGKWILHCYKEENFSSQMSPLQSIMNTGLWRIGKGFYGQMRPKLIGLGQMGRFISGKKGENHYLTEQHHLLSNMEEEETSWYGVVWGGMEWGSL